MRTLLCLISMTGVLWGCSTDESITIPVTGNETLDQLLKSAPASIIDLSSLPIDTVYVRSEDILGRESDASLETPVVLGRPIGMMSLNSHLYVVDQQQRCIWEMNREGLWTRKIGRAGRGPGEFSHPVGIFKNSNSIFVTDFTNHGVHVFDHKFNPDDFLSTPINGISLSGNPGFSVNDSLMFMPLNPYQHDELIQVRVAEPPFMELNSFWPKIIPTGYQFQAYNRYAMASNIHGDAVIVFHGLPYIFLLDNDQNHIHTLFIKDSEQEYSDNPDVIPVRSNEEVGVRTFVSHLYLDDDNQLSFFAFSKFYRFDIDLGGGHIAPEDNTARVFTYADPDKRKEQSNGIPITSTALENDTLYIASTFEPYIYRFSLK